MNEQERVRNAPQNTTGSGAEPMVEASVEASSSAPLNVTATPLARPRSVAGLRVRDDGGPRFWALPDRRLGWWIVRENDAGAAGLTSGKALILTPVMNPYDKVAAADCCRLLVTNRLRDVFHADLFNLLKRMMLGGMLCLAGLVGLRIPGGLEFLDLLLLLGALGYTAYAGLRYGARVLKSFEAVNHPFSQYAGEPFKEQALLERIAKALIFRQGLTAANRGAAPDEELLDANAFRTLIASGTATRVEIVALGAAITQRLGLERSEPVSIAEIAHAEGLDPESAALYRDVALAARELELEAPEFS